MSKPKNTKELLAYVEEVERAAGNVKVHAGIVWSLEQLIEEVGKHDSHNELIKLEVNHGFNPGKKCYIYTIYAYDVTRFGERTQYESEEVR